MKRTILAVLIALATLAALIALTTTAPSPAVDHLEPEGSVIGETDYFAYYHQILRVYFDDFYHDGIKARVIIERINGGEPAIGIRAKNGRYTIVTRDAAENLQMHFYESPLGGSLRKAEGEGIYRPPTAKEQAFIDDVGRIGSIRCEAPLEPALANRILNVWASMLRDTHFYPPPTAPVIIVGDPPSYHFSMSRGQGLAGVTSALPGKAQAALVRIVDTMWHYCREKKPAPLESTVKTLEDLLRGKREMD